MSNNKDKDYYKNKNEFFKDALLRFMLNKMEDLENDRIMIENRVVFHRIDEEDYRDMLINKTRRDYAHYIFRQIRELIDMYL